MKLSNTNLFRMSAAALAIILFNFISLQAQEKTRRIGNKPREGSSNSTFSVVKGNQLGVKMSAGRKPVQLMNLNFGVENSFDRELPFSVNFYQFKDGKAGENKVTQKISAAILRGKNRVNVDLEPYHLQVKGDLLVTIEWTETVAGANPRFAIGILNGGSYVFENDAWRRTPIFGLDFNVSVKKLK